MSCNLKLKNLKHVHGYLRFYIQVTVFDSQFCRIVIFFLVFRFFVTNF